VREIIDCAATEAIEIVVAALQRGRNRAMCPNVICRSVRIDSLPPFRIAGKVG
jgi:hypothetical protein